MPYWLKFTLYLMASGVVVAILAAVLSPLGRVVNLGVAFVAAYLTIIIYRWVLGRKQL